MAAARAEVERARRLCPADNLLQRIEVLAGGVDGAGDIGLGAGAELGLDDGVVGTGHGRAPSPS